jgi:hypothetical protein
MNALRQVGLERLLELVGGLVTIRLGIKGSLAVVQMEKVGCRTVDIGCGGTQP